jgi:hypothetical protein
MLRNTVLPDEITYSAASAPVRGTANGNHTESAVPHAKAKVFPNESTYCAAFSGGRRQLALNLLSLMPRITGHQMIHIQGTISACEMGDQWQSH